MAFLVSTAGPAIGAANDPPVEQWDVWAPIPVYLDPTPRLRHIPPTTEYTRMSRLGIQSANIHINYLAAGQQDRSGNTCQSWPADAAGAFDYAANVWETVITSTVTIEIVACWTSSLPPGVLGQSGTDNHYRNFAGAPQADTWYVTTLANALHGSRMDGSTVDMHISYASTYDWYFGTDGNTPANQTDFATVVLHEVGHGLGFAGSMAVQGSYGYWAWGTTNPNYQDPTMYDRLTRTGGGAMLLSLGNGTTALGSALVSDNVYFSGPYATAANGGTAPELYAPAEWRQGSSYSHLAESYNTSNGGRDSLMTWAIARGESIHLAGPVTMGVMKDVGWALVGGGGSNTAPTLSVPDVAMAINTTRALDLWEYASDAEDADSALTFTVVSVSAAEVSATLDGNGHTLNIAPDAGWTGTATVTVRVTDSGSLTANDAFEVAVSGGGNTAPTLEISDVALGVNESQALNLWNSADDAEDADAALIFTVVSVSDANLDAVLDGDGHTLNITPASDWTGSATVVVSVQDSGGLTAEDSFDVTVSGGSNTPPTLSIPDFAMAADATATLDLWDYAQDAESADAALTFSVGYIYDTELTAAIRDGHFLDITTTAAWTGETLMEVNVSDPGGLTGYSMFWVDLSGENTAPTLSIPDVSLAVNESRSLDLWDYADDADNYDSDLTFDVIDVSPANLTAEIAVDGHTLALTPDTGWTGAVTVEVQAADPAPLTANDTFVVYVGGGGNTAPMLSIPDVELALDASMTLNLWDYVADAEDADNTLVFTVDDTYDTELTAVIRDGHFLDITSTADWWGFTYVIVDVSDPGGLTDYSAFWVELSSGANTAPTLSIPDVSLTANENTTVNLWDYADDTEDLDYDLTFAVEGVSTANLTAELDSDGHTLYITPTLDWTGSAAVEISVSDTGGMSVNDSFAVNVGGGGNTAPTLSIADIVLEINANTALELRDYASDAEDADSALTFAVGNITGNITATLGYDGHTLDITPETDWSGIATVEITVSDTGGLTASDTFAVNVTNENFTPTLTIPNVTLGVNGSTSLDLWTFAADPNDADADLSFTVEDVSTLNLTATVRSERYLDIAPAPGWTGTATVEVSVSDPDFATASDTFDVIVSDMNYIYLPTVLR